MTDPLIENARLINMAAELERSLERRRELRKPRSQAAIKGWKTRNDK
jgi:hypothetical protein